MLVRYCWDLEYSKQLVDESTHGFRLASYSQDPIYLQEQDHEEFLSTKLDGLLQLMIEVLPSCHFSAKHHRLDCLYFLITHVFDWSEKLTKNRVFYHCNDLPKLNSYFHWTFDSSKPSLTLAFIALPVKPNGWIAWAINPTSTGMIGAQSLIAYKQDDGSMTVKTFNVTSYKNIERLKIAFDVPKMEAEYVDGVMRLYTTVVLSKNMAGATVNQVWQVGSSVTNGIPNVHGFGDDNLGSKGTLDLMSGQSNSTQSRGGNSNLKKRNIHGILKRKSEASTEPYDGNGKQQPLTV